jgi:TolB-like protein
MPTTWAIVPRRPVQRGKPTSNVERKLAAILAADMAGYSRLIGADEEGTLARLRALRRELIDPAIAANCGRIVKTTGDGILVEFASVVDAVRCAVELQRGMVLRNRDAQADGRIEFRVGIHLGDVVVEGDDLLGDGVNVAARLEGIAEPGGIFLSDDAYRQIRGKLDVAAEDLGEQRLKNIAQPVRAYRIRLDEGARKSVPALALPDKPSIAVLPFQNMSGDPEQEYFADGIVEEIITAMSRVRWLFVIARNSSFTYKGRAVDVRQVGRELEVRYVLEGSVRKAGNRVRITGQLIDTITGAHLWADHFDGGLEDVFDLQDQVTASVVGAIEPIVLEAEFERAKRKPATSAWDYVALGFASQRRWTREANAESLRLFRRAMEVDPDLAVAYALASQCYPWAKSFGWLEEPAAETAEGARLARRAIELGRGDPATLTMSGFSVAFLEGDIDFGGAAIDRALELNPNFAGALGAQRLDQGLPRRAGPRHRAHPTRHAAQPCRRLDVCVAKRGRLRTFFVWSVRRRPVLGGKDAAGASGLSSGSPDAGGERRARRSACTSGDFAGAPARARTDAAHFQSQGSDPVSPTRRPREIRRGTAQSGAPGVSAEDERGSRFLAKFASA